ncbi:DNA ligase, partial [archaeon]|nr:DNA ligase [archaeon]
MRFSMLADYLGTLEASNSRLKMTDIVKDLFLESEEDLRSVVLFVQGRLFPLWDQSEIGLASKMMIKCISIATGSEPSEVEDA